MNKKDNDLNEMEIIWHETENPIEEIPFGYIANRYNTTAGQILKALRIICGFEQKEVAHKIGAKQGVISKWELNLSTPSTEFIEPLADLYCIEIRTLLQILGYKEIKK